MQVVKMTKHDSSSNCPFRMTISVRNCWPQCAPTKEVFEKEEEWKEQMKRKKHLKCSLVLCNRCRSQFLQVNKRVRYFDSSYKFGTYRSNWQEKSCEFWWRNKETKMSSKKLIKVNVVSDIMWPWCWVGKRKLETAMGLGQDKWVDSVFRFIVCCQVRLNFMRILVLAGQMCLLDWPSDRARNRTVPINSGAIVNVYVE